MPVLESLLTIPDAAKLARVSARTMWRLIAAGLAPPTVRVGSRAVRLKASDVDLWLKHGCPRREELERLLAAKAGAA